MFEVGKKYKRCDKAYSEFLYECVYSDKEYGVLKNHLGLGAPFVTSAPYMYEEYKEPQKITRYVNIWKKPDGTLKDGGVMYPTEEDALTIPCGTDKRAGVAKLEFTESV